MEPNICRIIRFVNMLVNLATMPMLPDQQQDIPFRQVITVSELNREARSLLEASFPLLWIEGELSNLARPASGHLYFSLKDSTAQVRGAMFRNRSLHLRFRPENGMQVLVRARVSLYEPRGDYQLLVEQMEEAGDGALRRAFEALKVRLDREGLFASENKKPLPPLPRCIGVVTSPGGAAIRDILSVLKRRFPAIAVIVYPAAVQGEGAARQIATMIELAGKRSECDVLIVGRGGGSLEDLWAFNEEVVARAIHACPLPVVSAVGHEIDFTIADFVADQRAPTPSAAAELLSPDGQELLQRLLRLHGRLRQAMDRHLARTGERLRWLRKRLRHPGKRLQDIAQRLDELELRLNTACHHQLRHKQADLGAVAARLRHCTPAHRIRLVSTKCATVRNKLHSLMYQRLESCRYRLRMQMGRLDAVSPLAVLARGYAIIHKVPDGTIVRDSEAVTGGDRIEARLKAGRIICQVQETMND